MAEDNPGPPSLEDLARAARLLFPDDSPAVQAIMAQAHKPARVRVREVQALIEALGAHGPEDGPDPG